MTNTAQRKIELAELPPKAPVLPGTVVPGAATGPAPVDDAAVRPPVRASTWRSRHTMALLSFLLCVALPTLLSAVYLWMFAADEYVSRMGFSVRREQSSPAIEILSGLSSISGSLSSSDTDILYEYIQSQTLVAEMDRDLDLRGLWSKPATDPFYAVAKDAPIEDLVKYWNRMVRISFGSGSGLLEVEVRAFTPQDAHLIATMLLQKSSAMINDLSSIAQEDSIRYARDDLTEAENRLRNAREGLTRFRNDHQLVTPQMDVEAQAGILKTLLEQRVKTSLEIDMLRDNGLTDTDPRVAQATKRLQVVDDRIASERQKLGVQGSGGMVIADIVGNYEGLAVNREFAERAYTAALARYDASVAEARRKSRYLAAYMDPTLAQTPEYPHKITTLFLLALFLSLLWSVAVMVAYSIRDRR